MGVHRPSIHRILIAPNIIEQSLARWGASAPLDQGGEEFELGCGQLESPPFEPDIEFIFIESKIINLQHVILCAGAWAPQ